MSYSNDQDLKRQIGEGIRSLRRRRGINQADLAKAVGRVRPALSNIERGKAAPTVSLLVRLAGELEARIIISGDGVRVEANDAG